MADGHSRSPRRVSILTVAGFVLLTASLATWAYVLWTDSWVAAVRELPDQELESSLSIEDGARTTATFVPNVELGHLLVVWVDTGFPSGDAGSCPLVMTWSVEVDGEVRAEGGGDDLSWRAGHPGQGTIWLGKFAAVRDAEHVVTLHVARGLPEATARLELLRDDNYVKDAGLWTMFLSRLALVPFALGLGLVVLSWFARRYRIRRRG